MKKKNLLFIISFITILTITACATPENQDQSTHPDLIGTQWLWQRFDDTANLHNIVVDDPTAYTLLLNEDGTYNLQVDCNRSNGTYTLDGSSLSFAAGPTTLAACGPDSLDTAFMIDLSNVVAYIFEDDQLILNLWADGGNMVFSAVTPE